MKAGKVTRGRGRSEKFNLAKKGYLEELRIGMAYESGIALKNAKKAIKYAPVERNPKGIPRDQWRCKYYHPSYCNALGHADARSHNCFAHSLTAKEREVVLNTILNEVVQRRVKDGVGEDTYV